MRGRMVWVGLGAMALAACAPAVNVEQHKAHLMEADRAWSHTLPDIEAYLTYLAPDAAMFPPNSPVVSGHEGIRQMVMEMVAMPGFAVRWDPTKADVSASGELGYTTGTYEMTSEDPMGTPTTERGKYLVVWKMQADGRWKAVAESFNSDAAPLPSP